MRSDVFGQLLKGAVSSIAHYEGKTAPIVEDELGQQIGVTAASIQRYKTGHLPPESRTVQILAEAAVRRGFLNREWLQRFLQAARYPAPEKLLDELCPTNPSRPRTTRVYQNLPAPTYSQFVMRAEPFGEVIDGLQQRSAVVLIASLGGMGKTSLAREVAAYCLRADGDSALFDAAVWVSDKDRPGTTTLSIVLDEIARALDYPGFTQFAHDEKRREVEQLLRRQKVLLVVDNFETINDGALLAWLLRLPEPSKAIVTSREYSRAFRNNTYVVDLHGMSDTEAQQFIDQRLRFLKIEKLVGDRSQLELLVMATGGNPKALELALGVIKHERRSLHHVIDDLHAARGELFDDLFTHAWALLDEAAQRVLLVTTFLLDSASAETLAATADVPGFAFDRAKQRLTDLALLDVQQADLNSTPRYALHTLVRAFAEVRLVEQPEFETGARIRWIDWYIQLVSRVGHSWDDLSKLKMLDPEKDNIYTVIQWSYQHHYYSQTIRLVDEVSYYYRVRGLWSKQPPIHLIAAEAARNQKNPTDEARHLAFHIQELVFQDNSVDAKRLLHRIADLVHSIWLPNKIYFEYRHATALYRMKLSDFDNAQHICEEILGMANKISDRRVCAWSRRWLAECLYKKGQISDAQQMLQRSLEDSIQYGYQRSIIFCQIHLAAIEMDRGEYAEAEKRLIESSIKAQDYQDRRYIALTQELFARLHTLRGDLPAARAALDEAIDLFERLGMRRELAEARAELAQLDQ